MIRKDSIWFRLGYALEDTRLLATRRTRLRSLRARLSEAAQQEAPPMRRAKDARRQEEDRGDLPFDAIVVTGLAAAAARVLQYWPGSGRARLVALVRAGAAGAAAALVRQVLRPLLDPRDAIHGDSDELLDDMLVGAGQGLIYGALIEPWLPGPPPVRGAIFGTAEYVLSPLGGLGRIFHSAAPQSKVPVLEHLLSGESEEEHPLRDHLIFACVLAVLYRSSGPGVEVEILEDSSGTSSEK